MRSKVVHWWVMAVVIVAAIGLQSLLIGQAEGAWIKSALYNFDVHNFTDQPVNDFELVLEGISCNDISGYYRGWGYPPRCEDVKDGVRIVWEGEAIDNCTWVHLGVRLTPGAPESRVISATWTLDGEAVATVPFPWQTWEGTDECPVIALIWPDPEFTVEITRSWAVLQQVIPLDSLNQETVLTVLEQVPEDRQGRDSEPVRLAPGDAPIRLEIQTDPDRGDASMLVDWFVALPQSPKEPVLWFIAEAELSPEPVPVEPSCWGQIKSLFK